MPTHKVKGGYQWGNMVRFTQPKNRLTNKDRQYMPVAGEKVKVLKRMLLD